MSAELKDIPLQAIDANPENPRQIFHPGLDERLAESIESSGVLVPIYVYTDGERYILIDGERRWRQATHLGLTTIPALVRDSAPGDTENIVEMFNIHLVRAQWDDMPTAAALGKVMERSGITDLDELKRLTGLSKEKIKDYQLILDLPERYQDAVRNGLPMNFFVELEENVIRPLARQRPALSQEFSADSIRDAFLAKREAGNLPDVVELRLMRPIIKQAADDAGSPDEASDLDDLVRKLIQDSTASIEDTFTEVALAAVELNRLAGAARSLVSAVDRLINVTAESPSEREQLQAVVTDTIAALQDRVRGLEVTTAE
jgi:ParB family transcriptional regulator, chromosome partitioning protein